MYYLTEDFETVEADDKFFIFTLSSENKMFSVNHSLYFLFDHFILLKPEGFSREDLKKAIEFLYNCENLEIEKICDEVINQLICEKLISTTKPNLSLVSFSDFNSTEKIDYELPVVISNVDLSSIIDIANLSAFSFNLY